MKGLRWLLVMSALGMAACDGAKSPDFVPERTVAGFEILDSGGTPIAELELPVGTTEGLRARADITVTVPPGYKPQPGEPAPQVRDGKLVLFFENKEVFDTHWDSAEDATATVSESGVVTGVALGNTTVTGSYAGETDTVAVEVTDATLVGGQVRCVRPATTGPVGASPCVANGSFSRPSGVVVTFEAIGRFSDGQDRRIAAPYTLNWTSSQTTVAAKPATGSNLPLTSPNFETATIGSTTITGRVTEGADPADPLPNPAFQTATLNVVAANAFCDTEFPTDAQIETQTCIGCTANNTNLITDGNLETFADLNIPLGLLLFSNISVTVANKVGTPATAAGAPVGFLLSRTSNNVLAAQLLDSLEVTTVRRTGDTTFEDIADPATDSGLLRLTLLGIRLPASPQFLLSTDPTTEPYDGVKLTFNGGLLTLLASLNVNTACSRANPTPPAAP